MSTRIECDGCGAFTLVVRHGPVIELTRLNGWKLNSLIDEDDYCPVCWAVVLDAAKDALKGLHEGKDR